MASMHVLEAHANVQPKSIVITVTSEYHDDKLLVPFHNISRVYHDDAVGRTYIYQRDGPDIVIDDKRHDIYNELVTNMNA